jgi:hypothetical protein
VSVEMPLEQRVWRTSFNWLQANEIGMTFGFFFGAAALTVLATTTAAADEKCLRQFPAGRGGGDAAGRLRELRGADWARAV